MGNYSVILVNAANRGCDGRGAAVVTVELCRYPLNQKGLANPKTNSGYKTLIYYSAQANWRRPVLNEITREMMLFFNTINLYHVV